MKERGHVVHSLKRDRTRLERLGLLTRPVWLNRLTWPNQPSRSSWSSWSNRFEWKDLFARVVIHSFNQSIHWFWPRETNERGLFVVVLQKQNMSTVDGQLSLSLSLSQWKLDWSSPAPEISSCFSLSGLPLSFPSFLPSSSSFVIIIIIVVVIIYTRVWLLSMASKVLTPLSPVSLL